MFEHRPRDAEGEFLRALADKPAFATVHVRMALMCATLGQLDRALELAIKGRTTVAEVLKIATQVED